MRKRQFGFNPSRWIFFVLLAHFSFSPLTVQAGSSDLSEIFECEVLRTAIPTEGHIGDVEPELCGQASLTSGYPEKGTIDRSNVYFDQCDVRLSFFYFGKHDQQVRLAFLEPGSPNQWKKRQPLNSTQLTVDSPEALPRRFKLSLLHRQNRFGRSDLDVRFDLTCRKQMPTDAPLSRLTAEPGVSPVSEGVN